MLIFQNMIKEKNTVFFSGISNVDFSKYEQPPHPTPPSSPPSTHELQVSLVLSKLKSLDQVI